MTENRPTYSAWEADPLKAAQLELDAVKSTKHLLEGMLQKYQTREAELEAQIKSGSAAPSVNDYKKMKIEDSAKFIIEYASEIIKIVNSFYGDVGR